MTKEKAHAELSASGSERWLNCPGSVALSREAPEPPESKYALEGTIAHEFLEQWLRALRDGEDYKIPKALAKNKDMLKAVSYAVETIENLWDPVEEELLIEQKLSLEYIGKDMFGTADVVIVEPGIHLQVWDYKHGKGHPVDVVKKKEFGDEHNTQLIYYALAAARRFNFGFQKITIGIIQPRAEHRSGKKRSETFPLKDLLLYEGLFKNGVRRVYGREPKLHVGSWCHWCRAKDYNFHKK